MSKQAPPRRLTRRAFLKLGAGAVAAAAGARFLPRWAGRTLRPMSQVEAANLATPPPNVFKHFAASDGWIYLPGSVLVDGSTTNYWSPDPGAPAPRTTFVFGFRDMS